jgi:hypothetical protein
MRSFMHAHFVISTLQGYKLCNRYLNERADLLSDANFALTSIAVQLKLTVKCD